MIIYTETAAPAASDTVPHDSNAELVASLDELLHRFVNYLAEERAGPWSKPEEDVVRRARTALTNAGYPPKLGHETTAHLDYQLLDGSG